MSNKNLGIFGIITYLLTVVSSATDLNGNSTVPVAFIILSGLLTAIFFIWAIIRLWKFARNLAIVFLCSTIISSLIQLALFLTEAQYGSAIIILANIVKVVELIVTILVIVKLLRTKSVQQESSNIIK